MIVTITLNPSIDIAYSLDDFQLDKVSRVQSVKKTAGGKGLNVTRILHQLDEEVVASGFVGGVLGDEIKEQLAREGIHYDFAEIQGKTRNCIAVLHQGKQTEILEQGPTISEDEGVAFLNHFEKLINTADIVSISGSLPAGLSVDYYGKLLALCHQKHKPVVLDCSGSALKQALLQTAKPFAIKPNAAELEELLAHPVTTDTNSLKQALQHPSFQGIEWVMVSLGGQGMFAKHRSDFYQVKIPKISVVNPVGSGDATIAGFIHSLAEGSDPETIVKTANALGMLNAQEAATGAVNMENFVSLYNQIQVLSIGTESEV